MVCQKDSNTSSLKSSAAQPKVLPTLKRLKCLHHVSRYAMSNVAKTRESGVELLDTDVDLSDNEGNEPEDEPEVVQHFRTDKPTTINLGKTAGHPIDIVVSHFIAIEQDEEAPEMMQEMMGVDRVERALVVISNEDGEMGAMIEEIDGQGDVEPTLENVLSRFEDNHV